MEDKLKGIPIHAEPTLAMAARFVGFGFTVTVVVAVAVHDPGLVTVTVYEVVDEGLTEMD